MTQAPERAPAAAAMMPRPAVAELCRALAHENRLEILAFLTEPRYIEEIASRLGVARQTAEKHIAQLEEAGLVHRQAGRRDSGRVVEFVLVPQKLYVASEALASLGVPTPTAEDDAPLFRTEVGASPAPPPADGVPRLVLAHGRAVGRVFRLPVGTPSFVVGRDAEAAICLDYDPYISYRHAEIARGSAGLEIMDALSTNGTHVNGRRLGRGERAVLRHGDLVGVGHSLLVFRSAE